MKENRQLLLLLTVVSLCWFMTPAMIDLLGYDLAEKGQFGDQFGSLNALFSGLAFVGIIYTILLQQKQLTLQTEELRLQREELKLQREEMKGSRMELHHQVNMQHALIMATIAQIHVAAVNAEIEATKMDAEAYTLGGRSEHIKIIRKAAHELEKLASQLRETTPDPA